MVSSEIQHGDETFGCRLERSRCGAQPMLPERRTARAACRLAGDRQGGITAFPRESLHVQSRSHRQHRARDRRRVRGGPHAVGPRRSVHGVCGAEGSAPAPSTPPHQTKVPTRRAFPVPHLRPIGTPESRRSGALRTRRGRYDSSIDCHQRIQGRAPIRNIRERESPNMVSTVNRAIAQLTPRRVT
jgi:hypothetical protein